MQDGTWPYTAGGAGQDGVRSRRAVIEAEPAGRKGPVTLPLKLSCQWPNGQAGQSWQGLGPPPTYTLPCYASCSFVTQQLLGANPFE